MGDPITFNKDPQQKVDFDAIWIALKPAIEHLNKYHPKDPMRGIIVTELDILQSVFQMCSVVTKMVPDFQELLDG
jgi:hypothetical protein